MDAPESFAPNFDGRMVVDRKVSRPAIRGAIWLPLGILMAILFLFPPGNGLDAIFDRFAAYYSTTTTGWQKALGVIILTLGISSPFATTVLGVFSLSQIRAAQGKLMGRLLALPDTLFYPLLLLDSLLLVWMFTLSARVPGTQLAFSETLSLVSILVVVMIIDLVIVAIVWRSTARQPASVSE
jgi:hypothetical protein